MCRKLIYYYFCLYYPVTVPGDESKTFSQEDLPKKHDTDSTEVEVVSFVSGKKEIPVLTVNSSEGEDENTSFLC